MKLSTQIGSMLVRIFKKLNIINVILLCICRQKMVKWSIILLKKIDAVDILHAKNIL
jgi:hypothetical protein